MKETLESQVQANEPELVEARDLTTRTREYIAGCFNPRAQMNPYGTFKERTSFNTTKFIPIQASMLIRMGLMYPIMSWAAEKIGIPKDLSIDYHGFGVNLHTWAAGYGAYLAEIEGGLSKYPMELIGRGVRKAKEKFSRKRT